MLKSYKKPIKRILFSRKQVYRAVLEWSVFKQKRKSRTIYKQLSVAGLNVEYASQARFLPDRNKSVCHILCSGWSLLDSVKLAENSNSFVVGFNNAALYGITYNAYFVEFAGEKIPDLTQQQRAIVDSVLINPNASVYFKNVYQPHNDVKSIVGFCGNSVRVVRDVAVEYVPDGSVDTFVETLFAMDTHSIRQYISTVFTIMAIAKHSGFKDIVVHGLDFRGGYFFNEPSFCCPKHLLPPSTGGFYVQNPKDAPHNTEEKPLSVSALLPYVKRYLSRNHIRLFCGTERSPASDILPVFKG